MAYRVMALDHKGKWHPLGVAHPTRRRAYERAAAVRKRHPNKYRSVTVEPMPR